LRLVVTTVRGGPSSTALLTERAAQLAARFSARGLHAAFAARRGLKVLFQETGAELAYVVGHEHDAVVFNDGTEAFVQPGLLRTKLHDGAAHPFLRAVHGEGRATRVLDLTAGLGGDALHVAAGLDDGGEVLACEGSVVLHALLEEGLARLGRDPTWGPIARRVRLVEEATDHLALLRSLDDGAFDVIILDPMMRRPLQATPSFLAVRACGLHEPPTGAVFLESRRVAKRVVLKLGQAQAPPVALATHGFCETHLGVRVVYHVAPGQLPSTSSTSSTEPRRLTSLEGAQGLAPGVLGDPATSGPG
jgi:hypothetical protein